MSASKGIMMASAEGARIKLNRSERHIVELKTETSVFLGSQPFGLTRAEEPNGDVTWRVKVHRSVPTEWSAIIGDAVHNMRSALDLLAWQLVEVNLGRPTRDTCFPIGQAPLAVYDQQLRRTLAGASDAAIRFVRRLKPFAGGNTFLTRLHALDISDKHKLVLVVGAAHKHVVLKLKMKVPWQAAPVEFPTLALNPADRQFPLQDGAEVFRVCRAARESENEHDLVFELAFGDVAEVRGLPLIATLESMHRHVLKIIEIADNLFF